MIYKITACESCSAGDVTVLEESHTCEENLFSHLNFWQTMVNLATETNSGLRKNIKKEENKLLNRIIKKITRRMKALC